MYSSPNIPPLLTSLLELSKVHHAALPPSRLSSKDQQVRVQNLARGDAQLGLVVAGDGGDEGLGETHVAAAVGASFHLGVVGLLRAGEEVEDGLGLSVAFVRGGRLGMD